MLIESCYITNYSETQFSYIGGKVSIIYIYIYIKYTLVNIDGRFFNLNRIPIVV